MLPEPAERAGMPTFPRLNTCVQIGVIWTPMCPKGPRTVRML